MGHVFCANHTYLSCPNASLMANKAHLFEMVLSQEMTEFTDTRLQLGRGR